MKTLTALFTSLILMLPFQAGAAILQQPATTFATVKTPTICVQDFDPWMEAYVAEGAEYAFLGRNESIEVDILGFAKDREIELWIVYDNGSACVLAIYEASGE